MNFGLSNAPGSVDDRDVCDLLFSKILHVGSLSRHLQRRYRERIFRYDVGPNAFSVITELNGIRVVSLRRARIVVHAYTNEAGTVDDLGGSYVKCLSIRCDESIGGRPLEIVLRFGDEERFLRWHSLLDDSVRRHDIDIGIANERALVSLCDFLKGRGGSLGAAGRGHTNEGASGKSMGLMRNDSHATGTSLVDSGRCVRVTAVDDDYDLVDLDLPTFAAVDSDSDSSSAADVATQPAPTATPTATHIRWNNSPHSRSYIRPRPLPAVALPVPRMKIVMLVVGTRGDVQPFISIGRRLRADGHRVRLASHPCFSSAVAGAGLEFFALAGDPNRLSAFMVKSHGCLLPTSAEQLREVPGNIQMLAAIMHSCWGACTEGGFVADAIISNPVSYGHVHCAEALGVPLHMMFPQPWVPTKAFPHPLSCASYSSNGWSTENYLSYHLVDKMVWLSLEYEVNFFRKQVLNLEPLRMGDGGWDAINNRAVPFVEMWSPELAPKPKDWPAHVSLSGSFRDEPDDGSSTSFSPPADLEAFLAPGRRRPVFVGFGSMVIDDLPAALSLLLQAAALSGVRLVFQGGWSEVDSTAFHGLAVGAEEALRRVRRTLVLGDELEGEGSGISGSSSSGLDASLVLSEDDKALWSADSDAIFIGPCPHSWLFQHVAAVVHHGGAGTTAAGLLAGLPTWICPFFGDQHFWAEMVYSRGLGPEPCSVNRFDLTGVVASLSKLVDGALVQRCKSFADRLRAEDGAAACCREFYSALPLQSMLCETSIFTGEAQLAHVYCADCCAKLSREVYERTHVGTALAGHTTSPCIFIDWAARGLTPQSAADGVLQGLACLVGEVAGGVTSALLRPAQGVLQEHSLRAAAGGAVSGLGGLMRATHSGGRRFLTKIKAGAIAEWSSYSKIASVPGGSDQRLMQHVSLSMDAISSEKDLMITMKRFDSDICGCHSQNEGMEIAAARAAEIGSAFEKMRSAQQLLSDIVAGRGDGGPLRQALQEAEGGRLGLVDFAMLCLQAEGRSDIWKSQG